MKPDKKKTGSSAGRNPDRRNGKAWKKPKKPANAPTPERVMRNYEVLTRRQRTKEANIARREAARLAAEELKAQLEAEAEDAKRHDPVGVMTRTKRKKQKIAA